MRIFKSLVLLIDIHKLDLRPLYYIKKLDMSRIKIKFLDLLFTIGEISITLISTELIL